MNYRAYSGLIHNAGPVEEIAILRETSEQEAITLCLKELGC